MVIFMLPQFALGEPGIVTIARGGRIEKKSAAEAAL
jgi:hypothetical protein